MRVTAKVVSSGDRWGVMFPKVDRDACFPVLDGKMVAQPDECFRQLVSNDRLVQGVDYREAFLNSVVCHWLCLINGWKANNSISRDAEGYEKTVERLDRKTGAERVSYVRVDWNSGCDDNGKPVARFRIAVNDNGVFERSPWERMFAWKMAEAALTISDMQVERGMAPIAVNDLCGELYAELKRHCAKMDRIEAVRKDNEARFVCPNHRNGFCVPCQFGCKHYRQGKCVEIEEDD